jgi:hypothetical protein
LLNKTFEGVGGERLSEEQAESAVSAVAQANAPTRAASDPAREIRLNTSSRTTKASWELAYLSLHAVTWEPSAA